MSPIKSGLSSYEVHRTELKAQYTGWTLEGPRGGSTDAFIHVKYTNESNKELKLRHLQRPKALNDAARYQDTFRQFMFGGFKSYSNSHALLMHTYPGRFYLMQNANSDTPVELVLSRVDYDLNPLLEPMNTGNANSEHRGNIAEQIQIMTLEPDEITDEIWKMIYVGGSNVIWHNSSKYSHEGVITDDFNGETKKARAGNMVLGIDGWCDHWLGSSSMKKDQLYAIRVGSFCS